MLGVQSSQPPPPTAPVGFSVRESADEGTLLLPPLLCQLNSSTKNYTRYRRYSQRWLRKQHTNTHEIPSGYCQNANKFLQHTFVYYSGKHIKIVVSYWKNTLKSVQIHCSSICLKIKLKKKKLLIVSCFGIFCLNTATAPGSMVLLETQNFFLEEYSHRYLMRKQKSDSRK